VYAVKQNGQRRTELERLLRKNEFRQILVERELKVVQNKQEVCLRRFRVADFLKTCAPGQKINEAVYQLISIRASRAVEAEDAGALVKLEVKKELLAIEKQLLEAKLRDFGVSDDPEILQIVDR
jgi:hypothetical protein